MSKPPFQAKAIRVIFFKFGRQFWADERGATAIEYGLTIAMISLLVISAASTMGTELSGTFDTISSSLTAPPEFSMAGDTDIL